jgi:hypothetical protein
MPQPQKPRVNESKNREPKNSEPKSNEPRVNEPKNSEPKTAGTHEVSNNLRVIFRRKRLLALAKQRQGNRCALLRVVFHVYRRMHRRVMHMFVRTFVGVNLVRVLHRRPDVVKPLD